MKTAPVLVVSSLFTLHCLADTGPYLFLDDHLIAKSSGLTRRVNHPVKHPEPVIYNPKFGVTQPFVTVLRDPDTRHLRMWYCRTNELWYTTSEDGIRWSNRRVSYPRKRGYGAAVIDDQGRDPDPARRYKLADWESTRELDDTPKDNGGMWIQFSPDNTNWTGVPGNPVLSSWPVGYGKYSEYACSDIIDAFYDPIHKRYAAAVKLFSGLPEDPWSKGTRIGDAPFTRRIIGMTFSSDFVHWEKPWRIIVPDERDQGDMEFYCLGGIHARGSLLIGFVRALRDELPCDPGGPPNGIGWTTLAWSRDGRTWTRDHETFLDRNRKSGTWDHAMTWASSCAQVGNELLIYYGGYARGHKIEPGKERQIGLARMPTDRYVSRDAGPNGGTLLTQPFELKGRTLTVNADIQGEMRVRILSESGKPIRGYGWSDCRTIRGDSLVHKVSWAGRLSGLPEGRVQLEFQLQDAKLYAFDVIGTESSKADGAVIEIGSRLEPLVDDRLLDRIDGARLQLNHPVLRENVFQFDAPWEGDASTYVTVFKDDNRYRMYYRGSSTSSGPREPAAAGWGTEEVTCMAESDDGIRWTRPKLGLFSWRGSKENNIVWMGDGSHCFCPFKDANSAAKPGEKYKALTALKPTRSFWTSGLFPLVSADGYRWRLLKDAPVISKGAFDSLNAVFWDGERQQYVCYVRDAPEGLRSVTRAVSKDFLNWTKPEMVSFPGAPKEGLYTSGVQLCPRAPHIYVGFPMRFWDKPKLVESHPYPGISDGLFMTSRDGVSFHRWPEAFLRPGPGERNWTQRSNMAALGLLELQPGEMSLYYSRHYCHRDNHLERVTIRTDGFVSVHADAAVGEMVTKPIAFKGRQLFLNYATSTAGWIQVELQSPNGKPIQGFALANCEKMVGDRITQSVEWNSSTNLAALAGQPVRLRFQLKDADLYSLRFGL